MSHDVFISYSTQDKTTADAVTAKLEGRGVRCWIAPRDISPGHDWAEAIVKAIGDSRLMVVVFSSHANASQQVMREVERAINARVTIIPFKIDNAVYSLTLSYFLSTCHWLDALTPPIESHINALGDYVVGILFQSDHTTSPSTVSQPIYELGYRGSRINNVRRSVDGIDVSVSVDIIHPPMCLIPGGPFLMGSDRSKDRHAQEHKSPQHLVDLDDYSICKYPITVAEYACAVRDGVVSRPTAWQELLTNLAFPVFKVSWNDACNYARWMTQLTGLDWRLPTEAEWEKAARGMDGRIFPWGDQWDWESVRCNTELGKKWLTPVGSYPDGASPYGVYDMAGNVEEWTTSKMGYYPYDARDGREVGYGDFESRVLRGGSYNNPLWMARCSYRNCSSPDNWYDHHGGGYGFRLICKQQIA